MTKKWGTSILGPKQKLRVQIIRTIGINHLIFVCAPLRVILKTTWGPFIGLGNGIPAEFSVDGWFKPTFRSSLEWVVSGLQGTVLVLTLMWCWQPMGLLLLVYHR